LRSLRRRRYRAGDQALVAPGYLPEQANLVVRDGKLPLVRLL